MTEKITQAQRKALLSKKKGFCVVQINYTEIIIPEDQARMLIESLSGAELFDTDDGYDEPKVKPLEAKKSNVAIIQKHISEDEYLRMKMATLLGVPYSEVEL